MLPPGTVVSMTPDEHAHPQRWTRGATAVLTLACLLACSLAGARPLPFSVWLHTDARGGDTHVAATVALDELRLGDARAQVWARVSVAPSNTGARSALGAGTALRYADTLGPLGTVVFEGGGSLASELGATTPLVGRVWLGARGTLANAALSLALESGTAMPHEVDPVRPAPSDEAGRRALRALDDQRSRAGTAAGTLDVGARIGVTYRPERTLTGQLEASLRRLGGDLAATSLLSLRRSGVAAEVDAWGAVALERLGTDTAAAAGLGLLQVPRRGESSWLYGWFGVGPNGVWPGLEGRWAVSGAAGALRVDASWRPWLGADRWQAEVVYQPPLEPSVDMRLHAGVRGRDAGIDWLLALEWRGQIPSSSVTARAW